MTALEAHKLYVKFLRAFDRCIDKALAYAQEKKFEPDVLVAARLAPDQFAFNRQVQSACDKAKGAIARLAGREPPANQDGATTLAEVKARIAAALAYLDGFAADDFAGSADRRCSHPWMGEKWMRGSDYVEEYAIPDFLFHITTAYSILRHNGVPLGKLDFIAPLALQT